MLCWLGMMLGGLLARDVVRSMLLGGMLARYAVRWTASNLCMLSGALLGMLLLYIYIYILGMCDKLRCWYSIVYIYGCPQKARIPIKDLQMFLDSVYKQTSNVFGYQWFSVCVFFVSLSIWLVEACHPLSQNWMHAIQGIVTSRKVGIFISRLLTRFPLQSIIYHTKTYRILGLSVILNHLPWLMADPHISVIYLPSWLGNDIPHITNITTI